jgi:hypothetical protein
MFLNEGQLVVELVFMLWFSSCHNREGEKKKKKSCVVVLKCSSNS